MTTGWKSSSTLSPWQWKWKPRRRSRKNITRANLESFQSKGRMAPWECLRIKWGGCASMESREIKIAATERLNHYYDINICALMELNFNWTKVNSSANLASWFQEEEREMCCISAHNTSEFNNVFGKHQPGETVLVCRHKFLQYAKKLSIDPQGLGRWCSWPFSCNPKHVTWIFVAYRPCTSKVKGFKTVYQQHLRYIQSRGLKSNLVELFDLCENPCLSIKEGHYKWLVIRSLDA